MDLSKKIKNINIKGLVLISCNTGDVDVLNNVAKTMAEKVCSAPIIAPDGTVKVGYNICVEGSTHDAKGWYIYKKTDADISMVNLNMQELTKTQMIDYLNLYR